MIRVISTALTAAALLAACAVNPADKPDFAAQNRPLEERCARLQQVPGGPRAPGTTRAEVQAEARDAARRGEIDKACDLL
jgi:hypothetical protein